MVFPFYFVLCFLVFFGSLFSVSSVSWFGVWGGLEVNLLCFIPIAMHFSGFLGVESVVKYFLVQSFGSMGVLLGGLFEDSFFYSNFDFLFFLVFFSFFLKVGVFPFHWWVPGVICGFSWFGVMLLSTWQKLAPVFIFSFLCSSGFFFLFFSVFSSLIGGVCGVGQVSVRSIVAFSSISHAGWFFSLFCVSWFFGFFYFFIYLFSSFFLVFFFWFFDCFRVSGFFCSSLIVCFFFFICILTISGVPPFLGFFSKLFGFLSFGFSFLDFFFLFALVLGSLFSLYFYFGLFFSFFFIFFSFILDFFFMFWFFLVFCFFVIFSIFSIFFLDFFFGFF